MTTAMFYIPRMKLVALEMETSKKVNGRTIAEINQKIKSGDVQVLSAEEMKKLVESSGVEVAYK